MENKELRHYGILGMRWGVRRSERQLARIDKKSKKQNWSEDAETAAKIKTKNVKQLSNAELKKLNERIRLENEYANLNKRQKGAGEKFVTDIMRETAKNTITSYTTPLAKKYTDKGINFVADRVKSRFGNE